MSTIKQIFYNNIMKSLFLSIILFCSSYLVLTGYTQFVGNTVVNQAPIQEVEESIYCPVFGSAGHVAGEQYSWAS